MDTFENILDQKAAESEKAVCEIIVDQEHIEPPRNTLEPNKGLDFQINEEPFAHQTCNNQPNIIPIAAFVGARSRDLSPCTAIPEKSFQIKVPPSPVMRPSKQNLKEKQLLEWAKKALFNQDPPIKVTNLFSSWQNGLGFCALIRQKCPQIVPPINQLKTNQMSQNCQIAFEAASLLGIDTSTFASTGDINEKLTLDKNNVKIFLQELKTIHQNNTAIQLSDEDIINFQCRWYKKSGFFEDTVVDILQKQQMVKKRAEEEAEKAQQIEKERLEREVFEKEREDARKRLYENGQQFNLDEKDRSKSGQVKDLIKDAHNHTDSETAKLSNSRGLTKEGLDMPDTDANIIKLKKVFPDEEQRSPDSDPSLSTPTNMDHQSCNVENSPTSGYISIQK